ncbi:MAG: OmpA family protein [Methylovulum sp.]|nr:OmpA family protein [Methylovulum sp.]
MLKKKLLPIAIASLMGVGLLPLAQADDQFLDNRWYVAPFGTFINTGGDRNADNGWGAGMGIGKIINEHFNVELRGFYQGFDSKGPGSKEFELAGGTADLQYFFTRNRLAPYAVLAVGGMNTGLGARNVAGIIGEAGVGATYEVSDNFLVRSDVRYRYNNNFNSHIQGGPDDFHDMTINVGFVIPFGAKPKATAANFEAPIAAAPIVDCSTLDSDSDGVNDCLDQCPRTVKGSTVDDKGCPIKLVLKGEHFKFDSAELTLNAQEILDGVAQSLISYPQKNDIEVQGHTSSEGSDAYNMRLSQRRAESVADYLRMKNVPNRLITKGYGESQPVADNSTEEGRVENRRVELIWIEY